MSLVFYDGQYSHIRCDAEGCDTVSPPREEMTKNHGLAGCGWYVYGGLHLCPTHRYEFEDHKPRGPQYWVTDTDKASGKAKYILDPNREQNKPL